MNVKNLILSDAKKDTFHLAGRIIIPEFLKRHNITATEFWKAVAQLKQEKYNIHYVIGDNIITIRWNKNQPLNPKAVPTERIPKATDKGYDML